MKILETLITVNTFLQLNLINSEVLRNGSLLGSSFDRREIYGVNNIMIRLLCIPRRDSEWGKVPRLGV